MGSVTYPRSLLSLFGISSIIVSIVSASAVDQAVSYRGWRILEVVLEEGRDPDSSPTIRKLRDMEEPNFMEILRTARDRGVAEVAASPEAVEILRMKQQADRITFSTVVEDLGKKVASERLFVLRGQGNLEGAATFDRYMEMDEIHAYINKLAKRYPNKVKVEQAGTSVEGRPIYLVKVTDRSRTGRGGARGPARGQRKPVIFVDAGIHAREWISPASAVNLLERLMETPSLTKDIEWQIIPLLNPDGYEYSWTNDRLWRKNRAKDSWQCTGTDLNRNFDFHWGETGASSSPCSQIFMGNEPFSEPESKVLRDVTTQVKDRMEAYISIHSYGQMILHPWGYTSQRERYNEDHLGLVGNGMANAIQRKNGVSFDVGSPAKLLYSAAGGSDDWVAGVLKTPLSYTFELRDKGYGGFILPESQIKPGVDDFWVAMKYLAREIMKKSGMKSRTKPAVPVNTDDKDFEENKKVQSSPLIRQPQHTPQANPPQVRPQANPPQVIPQANPPQHRTQANPPQLRPQANPPQLRPQANPPQVRPQVRAQANPPQLRPQANPTSAALVPIRYLRPRPISRPTQAPIVVQPVRRPGYRTPSIRRNRYNNNRRRYDSSEEDSSSSEESSEEDSDEDRK